MIIAVASGKGGTGKTTVATNLAVAFARQRREVHLLDCDVEAPNCHLFLHPHITGGEPVEVLYPRIIADRCNGCRKCADFCEFGALLCAKDTVLVLRELCHSCGGCVYECPTGAIEELPRPIGTIESGTADGIAFWQGRLHVGEARAVPVISTLRRQSRCRDITIIDAPPGTTCPMIEAVRGCDFVCLVTEPTPFGLHDLRLAAQAVKALGLRAGVVINRADLGRADIHAFCVEASIAVLAEWPNDRRLATCYARGELASHGLIDWRERFDALAGRIEEETALCAKS